MKALVTGSAGFVGRHFVRALEQLDHDVYTCDLAWPQRSDCRDGFRTDSWSDVDAIFHCAATIPPIDARVRNDLTVANDLSIDAEMWQWATRNDVQVVCFSSSAAYPLDLQSRPYLLREDDIDFDCLRNPDAMYGWTKLTSELQAREAARIGVRPPLVVRPFSGYGTDQTEDYPFRAIVERVRRGENPVKVYGSGEQVRDFIHVDDIVYGVLTMLDEGFTGPVNLGTGRPTRLVDLARMVCRAAGHDASFDTDDSKPVGAFFRCADTTLLDTVYTPQISLERGIAKALGGEHP